MKALVTFPLIVIALIVAYRLGRCSVQDANDLVGAGFTITDPEGFECHDFTGDWSDTLTTYYETYIVRGRE